MTSSNIAVLDYQATCAAGTDLHALRQALRQQKSGLRRNDMPGSNIPTWIGKVANLDTAQDENTHHSTWASRNNALIELGLQQGELLQQLARLKARFGNHRIGVVMGSSTSSIDRAESAYLNLDEDQHLDTSYLQDKVFNPHAPGLFVAHYCDLNGPTLTINTACSSSAKVFATAARWLNTGIVDAVLVGGADTLCLSVLHGFHALQLVSENPCMPFDQNRDGINLGEAAGFALLTRLNALPPEEAQTKAVLTGFGESSDAHHMSHPHPEGLGARLAIEQALRTAQLFPEHIDYINLHGTASQANDFIEGRLIGNLFPKSTVASSTKGWMGHTLGAAGIIEAIIAIDALHTHFLPGTLNLRETDREIDIALSGANEEKAVQHVMSNSFGFGGNNCCLIFSSTHP